MDHKQKWSVLKELLRYPSDMVLVPGTAISHSM